MRSTLLRNYISILCLISTLSACAITPGKPSQFYVLQPDQSIAAANTMQLNNGLSIGLGPVTLPVLYDRPQIVTYANGNRVELSEYHRWGGELDANLQRILMQNLMAQLGSNDVLLYPWPVDHAIDFQVSVQLLRFGGQLGQTAQLEGVLRVFDGADECQLAVKQFDIHEDSNGADYAAYVDALSRGLTQLSVQIMNLIDSHKLECEHPPVK